MVIEHFILSNQSSIDANTNSLSVFGILDDMQIQAPAGASLNLTFHAILIVKREEEQGDLRTNFVMTVKAPNGALVGQEMKLPVHLQPIHRRSRIRVIAEIPIQQSGTYRIRMSCVEQPSLFSEVGLNVQVMPVAVPPPSSVLPQ